MNVADTLLEQADPRLDQPLPFLGGVILRVLTQIAQLAGPLDFQRQFGLQLLVELHDFVFELLEQSCFHFQEW